MSVAEAAGLIGKTAQWTPGNGLAFAVVIKDIKVSYGCKRYLVAPVQGSGETWVQSGITMEGK